MFISSLIKLSLTKRKFLEIDQLWCIMRLIIFTKIIENTLQVVMMSR